MKKLLVLMVVIVFVLGMAVSAFAVTTTGTYYRYSLFATGGSQYKGGGDVDTYGDTIYVNRDGTNLDVYTVTLLDTDGDSVYEPDQHPDNPSATGPMEARTLKWEMSYSIPKLDNPTVGEIYAAANGVYFLGQSNSGIEYFDFTTKTTTNVISSTNNLSHLGYDDVNGKWYASNEYSRTVYSWTGSTWATEFSYANMAGSHMDGLEVVTDPDTNIPYVYVSDMTSDYLGQWRYDTATSTWVNDNIFGYNAAGAGAVEGMGFGALGHFWATTGFDNSGALYEIGGGDLGGYVPPPPAIPEPGTVLLLGIGLVGLAGYRKKLKK